MKASDGKYRLTDVVDIEGMFRIIESVPIKNAEPIKQWLAKLGSERINETFDPFYSSINKKTSIGQMTNNKKYVEAKKLNEVMEKEKIAVENMIYEIKGKQVMLDTDLAILYKTETKRINEAVSRNSLKFPDRFCFKISEKEYSFLKSQIATSKGGSRKGHTVFTEEEVAMLASVLRTSATCRI